RSHGANLHRAGEKSSQRNVCRRAIANIPSTLLLARSQLLAGDSEPRSRAYQGRSLRLPEAGPAKRVAGLASLAQAHRKEASSFACGGIRRSPFENVAAKHKMSAVRWIRLFQWKAVRRALFWYPTFLSSP